MQIFAYPAKSWESAFLGSFSGLVPDCGALWRVRILESEIADNCSYAFGYNCRILLWRLDSQGARVIHRDVSSGAVERRDEVCREDTAQ